MIASFKCDRELTVKLLSSTGLVIHQAADPLNAIKICNEINGQFDLLLTDVIMPNMNGKELSDQLSKLYDFTTIYVPDMLNVFVMPYYQRGDEDFINDFIRAALTNQ